MANNAGKYRALFGVLIVFIIPFVLITGVYLSPKPKHKVLPILNEDPIDLRLAKYSNANWLTTIDEDIKLLIDTTDGQVDALEQLYKKTLTYPERTFKELHSKIIFVYAQDADSLLNDKYKIYADRKELQKLTSKLDRTIVLLGRNDRIRGVYALNEEEIDSLSIDLQHLMVETLRLNSEKQRIFK